MDAPPITGFIFPPCELILPYPSVAVSIPKGAQLAEAGCSSVYFGEDHLFTTVHTTPKVRFDAHRSPQTLSGTSLTF